MKSVDFNLYDFVYIYPERIHEIIALSCASIRNKQGHRGRGRGALIESEH